MSRYINTEWLENNAKEYSLGYYEADEWATPISLLETAPSIDIVRCQDCKYWVYNFNGCSRNPCTEPWYATDGCTYGEREGE